MPRGLGYPDEAAGAAPLAPGGAPPPGAAPAGAPDAGAPADMQDASPEEQEVYNRVVALGMLAIYNEKMMPRTVEFLKSAPDPVDAVAEVAAAIAGRVYAQAKEDGTDIPGDVLLPAGHEIVAETAALAHHAGVASLDEGQVDAAFYKAAEKFSQNARQMGIYGPEQEEQDRAELSRMVSSGELDGIMQQIAGVQQKGTG